MRRTDHFLISQKPYAVDLNSLHTTRHEAEQDGREYYNGRINAIWFRRRRGVTVACIGTLWDLQHTEPSTGREFLERHDDGRYGGDCDGRWDGTGYWGAQDLTVMQAHLDVLRPMLAAYPAIPDGWDGWWTFQPAKNS